MISPYGGRLIDLRVPADERKELFESARTLPSLQLSQRAVHDLELLAQGAFSPLDRFMRARDYTSVLETMRLSDGTVWPIPIALRVGAEGREHLGQQVALRTAQNELLAVMRVEEAYAWSLQAEAEAMAGKVDPRHPLVAEMASWGETCLSGELKVLALPQYPDFPDLRLSPAEVRARLAAMGHSTVVAFQTRNPMHRSHEELTKRAAALAGGSLLIHPVVGMTRPGDVDYYTRVRSYRAMVERYYDPRSTLLSLLPLAMRMAGPREALWHALIRRNYGASHFIVGRDHAGPGNDSAGKPFYGPYDAQKLVEAYRGEIGVTPLFFEEMQYLPDESRYEEAGRVPKGARTLSISGTQVRSEFLAKGRALPEWFTRPEIAAILAEAFPGPGRKGFCLWLTGLSGAGKTATVEALVPMLLERGRQVTVLDGDVVRTHLSKGLGFSREDRDTNIRRIGFVAAEIVRHGGAVLCAAISPYRSTRNECRSMVGEDSFVEVFVDTPIEVCEQRDSKGLYALARAGQLKGFTGVDDPYEPPLAPEIVLDTTQKTAVQNGRQILEYLIGRGFAAR